MPVYALHMYMYHKSGRQVCYLESGIDMNPCQYSCKPSEPWISTFSCLLCARLCWLGKFVINLHFKMIIVIVYKPEYTFHWLLTKYVVARTTKSESKCVIWKAEKTWTLDNTLVSQVNPEYPHSPVFHVLVFVDLPICHGFSKYQRYSWCALWLFGETCVVLT